jgi:hypothetical protein
MTGNSENVGQWPRTQALIIPYRAKSIEGTHGTDEAEVRVDLKVNEGRVDDDRVQGRHPRPDTLRHIVRQLWLGKG